MFLPLVITGLCTVQHDKIRNVGCKLGVAGPNEHVFDEMGLPGNFGDKPYREACVPVCTTKRINHKQTLA